MNRVRVPGAVAIATAIFFAARWAAAECTVDRDLFACPDWGVEMFVPPDWELSAQSSYPGILASGVHRPGRGRLTLAVQKLQPDEQLKAYAERNRATLDKVKFRVGELTAHPTGAYVLDLTSPDRKRRLRQAYLAHQRVAYVLTVAAPVQQMKSYLRAFDDTLRSVQLFARTVDDGNPVEPPTPPTSPEPPTPPTSPEPPEPPTSPEPPAGSPTPTRDEPTPTRDEPTPPVDASPPASNPP